MTVGGLLLTAGAVAAFLWLSRSKANERWIRSKPGFRNFSSRVFELVYAVATLAGQTHRAASILQELKDVTLPGRVFGAVFMPAFSAGFCARARNVCQTIA
jgi:hypothetical protein